MINSPLLAQELENLTDVKFPVYVSPKLDGIRCLTAKGDVLSRSFKRIPNKSIWNYLIAHAACELDGELLTYTDGKLDSFNTIQSKVMSEDGQPEFTFAVFDWITKTLDKPFKERFKELSENKHDSLITVVPHTLINNLEELIAFEAECVADGHEGMMLRSPDGRYKCGRSTLKEGILLKYKRFIDSEARILEIREQEKNIGAKGINELGKTKRSHKKSDKALAGTMGEFWVKDIYNNIEFGIGTGIGLTKELRQELWDNKDKYLGKLIKYKYQKIEKNKPRFPSFLGFRDERDMS